MYSNSRYSTQTVSPLPHEPRAVPRSLPRGRSHLPREVVLMSQRERLIEAAAAVVGTNGYAASTVGDIIKAARVSRTTFYEQFGDKEECVVVAYEAGAQWQFERVRIAAREPAGGVARLQAGVRAYLEALTEEPLFARMSLIEILAAGPAAAAARAVAHRRYAALLRKWQWEARMEYEGVPEIVGDVFECAVGGVADVVAARLRHGDLDQLPAMAPVIVTFLLNVAALPAGRELAAALAAARSRGSRSER
jgi:AcrR family transcriptional regulator